MAVNGFHSEWVTIGRHRVFLECRCSFPGDEMRFIAQVAAKTIDSHSEDARLVSVFFNDNAGTYDLKIASDTYDDRELGETVEALLCTMCANDNRYAQVVVVRPGNKESDRYDHMEHLSRGAGVLVA